MTEYVGMELDDLYGDRNWDWLTKEDDEAMWQEHLRDEQEKASRVLSPEFYVRLRADADNLVTFWEQRCDAYYNLVDNHGDNMEFANAAAVYDTAATDFAADYAELSEFASLSGRMERTDAASLRNELAGGIDQARADELKAEVRAAVLEGMEFRKRMDFVEKDLALGAEPDPPEAQGWMDEETISQFRMRDMDVEWADAQFGRSSKILAERLRRDLNGDEPGLDEATAKALGYGKDFGTLEREAGDVRDAAENKLSDFVDYAERLMDRQPVLFDERYRGIFEQYVDSQDPVKGREPKAKQAEVPDLSKVDLGRKGASAPAKQQQKDIVAKSVDKSAGADLPEAGAGSAQSKAWGED